MYMWDVSYVLHLNRLLTVYNAYCFNHPSFDMHLQSAAVGGWFHPQTGQWVDVMCGELQRQTEEQFMCFILL